MKKILWQSQVLQMYHDKKEIPWQSLVSQESQSPEHPEPIENQLIPFFVSITIHPYPNAFSKSMFWSYYIVAIVFWPLWLWSFFFLFLNFIPTIPKLPRRNKNWRIFIKYLIWECFNKTTADLGLGRVSPKHFLLLLFFTWDWVQNAAEGLGGIVKFD